MSAQYANLDARHWVNEDFVNEVRELYPATTKKIPLGYSTYTGWTGKDEILFIAHDPLDDEARFEGQLYEASFDDVGAKNFRDKVLDQVEHSAPAKAKPEKSASTRQRKNASLDQRWGTTLDDRMKQATIEKQARRGTGLYGYPKPIVSSCESLVKKLNRKAAGLMHKAIKKDKDIVSFLETHARRGQSSAARTLLAAYKNSMPQTDFDDEDFEFSMMASDKEAGMIYGMYGFPRKTARMGLSACTTLREAAGTFSASLHRRKAEYHERITGFFGEHSKTGHCYASSLLLSCYPESGFKFRRASGDEPKTVAEWLTWDPNEL